MHWPDHIDEVLDGDQAIMLAYVTPAKGTVMLPVTNFGIRDRERGVMTPVNSSVGVSRKLERIRSNPHVALAYHTREHGFTDRPEYVLVQGVATLSEPNPRYMDSIRDAFERYARSEPRGGRITQWWLRPWHLRVGVEIAVHRIVAWPDLACRGEPEVHGAPLPEPPAPQRAPANGTGPRIRHRRAAARAASLPYRLLGWVGSDGFPMVVPVGIAGASDRGILLDPPAGLVPPGGRRAGLTAHRFERYVVGMSWRVHTGWLEHAGGDAPAVYAPHTRAGVTIPASRLAYKLMAGAGTRWGMRAARQRGFVPG